MTLRITAAISHLAIKPCWLVTLDSSQRTARKIRVYGIQCICIKHTYMCPTMQAHKYTCKSAHTHNYINVFHCPACAATLFPPFACWPCQPDAQRNLTPVFYILIEPHISASCTGLNQKSKPNNYHPTMKYPSKYFLLFLDLVVQKQSIVCRTATFVHCQLFLINPFVSNCPKIV